MNSRPKSPPRQDIAMLVMVWMTYRILWLLKARLHSAGSMKLTDLVTVHRDLDEKDMGGKFWARLVTAGLDRVHIDNKLVFQYARLLTGGVWANIELTTTREWFTAE